VRRGPLLAVLATAVVVILGFALIALRNRSEAPTGPAQGGAGHAGHGVSADRGPGKVVRSVRSGRWTDRAVWGGRLPGTTDTARVAGGTTVSLDAATARVAGVQVAAGGTLAYDPEQSASLESTGNVVVEGVLAMKPASGPVRHRLRFVDVEEGAFQGGGMVPLATDVGLWVMGPGRLDLAGTPRTGWTRAAAAIDKGAATITLAPAPSAWEKGDEISVAPTGSPSAGDAFTTGFDLRGLAGSAGARLTLDAGVDHPHPVVGGRWRVEVMNLTRNVIIEGIPKGRAHVFIHSTSPQSVRYAALRYLGPRKPNPDNDGAPGSVLGRYGLHFHVNDDSSRGSLVEGVVVRDTGAHAYVAHQSHGVTFRDTVAYNTYGDAYWWDVSPDTRTEGPETDDTLYDHAIAALVNGDNDEGYRMGGFSLSQGARNEVRDSVAVGVRGLADNRRALSAGFVWPETFGRHGHGVWNFSHGNRSHNNLAAGVFNWQNDGLPHVVNDFVAYHNGSFGVAQGAYLNSFKLLNTRLYGNHGGAVLAMAASSDRKLERRLRFQRVVMDGAGLSDHLVVAQDHTADGTAQPVLFKDTTMRGFRKAAIAMAPGDANEPYAMDFVDTRISGTPFWFVNTSEEGRLPAGSYIRVQNGSSAFRVSPEGSDAGAPVPAWNARRQPIAPFLDRLPDGIPPQVAIAAPLGGGQVSGTVPVRVDAFDDVRVTRVEWLVDGVVKGSDSSAPFAFAWDTGGLEDRNGHRLQLKAYDAAGNANLSGIRTVFVGRDATP
jgi:hypothetical protein